MSKQIGNWAKPEHYITDHQGNQVLVGPYTQVIRDHYIAYKVAKHRIDYPQASEAKANKYAKVQWARKINKVLKSAPKSNVGDK